MIGRVMSVVLLAGLATLAGCGGGGAAPNPKLPRVAASGKVDFDGAPIPAGSVVFYHIASGTPAIGEISECEYTVSASEGPVVGENSIAVTGLDKPEGAPLWTGKWSKTVTI